MTNLERKYAYINVKNYINAQIAYTKEKIKEAESYNQCVFALDKKDELEAYLTMLNLLSDNMKKIIGG